LSVGFSYRMVIVDLGNGHLSDGEKGSWLDIEKRE
jgi:hypothetical protein